MSENMFIKKYKNFYRSLFPSQSNIISRCYFSRLSETPPTPAYLAISLRLALGDDCQPFMQPKEAFFINIKFSATLPVLHLVPSSVGIKNILCVKKNVIYLEM